MTTEEISQNNIHILPLQISTSTHSYKDGIDIQKNDLYEILETEIPKTSMPAAGDAWALIQKLKDQGFEQIISIHLSQGLSGTYQMVNSFKEKAKEIGVRLEVIDSKTLSKALGFIVLEAARLLRQNLPFDELVDKVKASTKDSKLFFVIKTLEYLKKGGRIGKVEGTLGEILNFKPIISVGPDGVYYTVDKVRGRNKSLKTLKDIVVKSINDKKVHLTVLHGNAFEEGKKLLNDLMSDLGDSLVKPNLMDLTPSLSVHVGPGLVGVALFPSK